MTKDEALKMAIEVLNEHEPDWECNHGYHHNQCPNVNCECKEKKYWKTLDACKEAVKSHFEIGIKSDLGKDFVYTYRLLPDKDGLYWMLQSDLKEALEQPAQKPELADTISVEDYQKLREQPVEVIASGQLRFKKKKYLYAYIDTRFGKIAFSTEWSKNSAMPLLGKIEVQDE